MKIVLTEEVVGAIGRVSCAEAGDIVEAVVEDAKWISFRDKQGERRVVFSNDYCGNYDYPPRYVEIPEGYVAAKATGWLDCYTWAKGDYIAVKEYNDDMYYVANQSHNITLKSDVTLLELLGSQSAQVGLPAAPALPVEDVAVFSIVQNIEDNKLYKVHAINVNGSYMVTETPQVRDYEDVPKPMSVDKCHPQIHLGMSKVPCRSASFLSNCDYGSKGHPAFKTDLPTMEVRKLIKKQEWVAAEALERIKESFPSVSAKVMGGAPRNWIDNKPAKDIDIFLGIPNKRHFNGKMYPMNQTELKGALVDMGMEDVMNITTHKPDGTVRTHKELQESYKDRMEGIYVVFDANYHGVQVQFIFVHDFKVNCHADAEAYFQDYFDTSVNMVYASFNDHKALVHTTELYDVGRKYGCVLVNDNSPSYASDHLERIAGYYPDIPMVREKHLKDIKRRPNIVWEVSQDFDEIQMEILDESQSMLRDIY